MRNTPPVVNISRTNIHYDGYDGKKQKPRRRIKTTPLQILDHALPYLLFFAAELIQSMKKALLPPFASGGTTHKLRTYSLQESAVPAARKAAAPG